MHKNVLRLIGSCSSVKVDLIRWFDLQSFNQKCWFFLSCKKIAINCHKIKFILMFYFYIKSIIMMDLDYIVYTVLYTSFMKEDIINLCRVDIKMFLPRCKKSDCFAAICNIYKFIHFYFDWKVMKIQFILWEIQFYFFLIYILLSLTF